MSDLNKSFREGCRRIANCGYTVKEVEEGFIKAGKALRGDIPKILSEGGIINCKINFDKKALEELHRKMEVISYFETQCSLCGGKLELLKDPEGKVYHGDCWSKLNKKVGEK